ncbi:ROK family protein [Nocardioides lianchengensis]|uniref:ROK family protein n=1 Tax=Nocardioides lianchengensis TaxID=1045774 RepID=UPI00244EC13B|nr:ROK family protein [Nocardioides lianchengensis]
MGGGVGHGPDPGRPDAHAGGPLTRVEGQDVADVLALDIGGTKTVAAVVAAGTTHPLGERPTPTDGAAAIEDAVVDALDAARAAGRRPASIGLSVAGLVETDRSTVALAPNLPLREHDLGGRLRARTGLPVVVENDVNAAGWGEYLALPAPVSSYLVVMVGTGLGGAFVADGHLVRGVAGLAMEVGHLVHEVDGAGCGCGGRGCWEQYASGTALVQGVRRTAGAAGWTGRDVQAAADRGDPVALAGFAGLGEALGEGLADLVLLTNPEVVTLGGGVARSAGHFLGRARQVLAARLGPNRAFLVPELRLSVLGPVAALTGVADLALDRLPVG